ncbi:caspase domain-containing protein [Streptomyces sp. NPDC050842]|uniref:caspase domain-containing protein n=1 Tax=Streptomyces sp. NPDC050842 TaxID=3365636 RepID=UPI0037BCDEF4
MTALRALLVGIDNYPAGTATSLTGCVNDVTEAHRFLRDRLTGELSVRTLLDGEATREAVEDAVREHLGRAREGDIALFWFSGHGTETLATGADARIEATGRNQALVCVDALLPDKRLGRLLHEVAANGAHVAAVLDCCFAGGATRDRKAAGGTALDREVTSRFAPMAAGWRPDDFLPEPPIGAGRPRDGAALPADGPAAPHVLLAASRINQPSYEGSFGGRRHGAFTYALLGAAKEAGGDLTYRELLAAADARMQLSGGRQRPVLHPATPGGIADTAFLAGTATRAPSPHLLRFGAHGWEVDCGAVHGVATQAGAPGPTFGVTSPRPEDGPGTLLHTREVRATHTLVEPVGWAPVPTRVYPVAVSSLPVPSATVTLDALPPAAAWTEVLRTALRPSPQLRVIDGMDEAADLHFQVSVEEDVARVLRRDGTPFTEALRLSAPDDAHRVRDCLEHLTRWHRIRGLSAGPSTLDGLVRVEITPWGAEDGPLLTPDGGGEIVCAYTGPSGAPVAPFVSIRLHNRSRDKALWCVLLDLTDSYACHSLLYPGHFIGPGRVGHALDGEPVQLSLPPTRPAAPGAAARDWLKLIVCESEFSLVPYELNAWDPRGSGARVAGRVTAPATRWTTRTLALRTVVPTVRGG